MPQIPPYFVYTFPFALGVFVAWWFFMYTRTPGLSGERSDHFTWVREGPRKLFNAGTRGRMSKADVLPLLLITAAYSAFAFTVLGNTTAPESFWRATDNERSVLIDLGEPVMVDTVFYYTGNFHDTGKNSYYELEFSEDGINYRGQHSMEQKHSMTFQWRNATLESPLQPTRYIRITAAHVPLELGELGIIASRNGERFYVTDKLDIAVAPQSAQALFDEQDLIPSGRATVNSAYFDEIYHARAAYEFNNGIFPYEITHPPLGKEIIALGTRIFGMTPFGWRFMGTLFGVLMLPLLYLLLKQLFNSTFVSVCATVIWAADFMHFTQTRIATIDTYNVFFVLLMFIFMHRWITLPDDTPFLRTLPPLFMCGLSFGLGAAAKWSSIYAGFGLVLLYVIKLIYSRRSAGFVLGTLVVSTCFFLFIPGVIYILSYIPYVTSKELDMNFTNLWNEMLKNQTYMYKYHSRLVDTHVYAARWYDWVFNLKPICYFYQREGTNVSTIMALNNPLLAWGGLVAMVFCGIEIFVKKCSKALFIMIGYLSVLLPWVLVSRLTFAYHYFPALMFLVLGLGHVFWRMTSKGDHKARRSVVVFTTVAVVLFLMFYPVLSGVPVSHWYTKNVLQWLPAWPL
jgi:hypothetical protein